MKILKIALLTIFASSMLNAQDLTQKDVPSVVMIAFQNTYNNMSNVEWEKDGNHYKVEFDDNNIEHEIWYSKEGIIVKSEKEITENQLPNTITTVLERDYPNYKIESIELIESENKTTYEVELEKAKDEEIKVVFDATGSVLSSKKD